jgi:DNA-binding transcriptional LysR family regulator
MKTEEAEPVALWNPAAATDAEAPPEAWQAALLAQYELYVEMADRISSRRATANSYFLSLNSALLVFGAYVVSHSAAGTLPAAAAGVTLCWLWSALLRSYRRLSGSKWQVVVAIESRLAIRPYAVEWAELGGGTTRQYWPLGRVETAVPFIFMFLHAVVAFEAACGMV